MMRVSFLKTLFLIAVLVVAQVGMWVVYENAMAQSTGTSVAPIANMEELILKPEAL